MPGQVFGGRDIGAGKLGQRIEQAAPARVRREVAAIEQQVAIGAEGVAPASDDLGIVIEVVRGQPRAAELDARRRTVRDDVHRVDVTRSRQGRVNLLDAVLGGVEHDDGQLGAVIAVTQVLDQLGIALDAGVDEDQFASAAISVVRPAAHGRQGIELECVR